MQRLYLRIERYEETFHMSNYTLSNKLFVKVTEIVPGRNNYDTETIYEAGDLEKAFLADEELWTKYRDIVFENQKYSSE